MPPSALAFFLASLRPFSIARFSSSVSSSSAWLPPRLGARTNPLTALSGSSLPDASPTAPSLLDDVPASAAALPPGSLRAFLCDSGARPALPVNDFSATVPGARRYAGTCLRCAACGVLCSALSCRSSVRSAACSSKYSFSRSLLSSSALSSRARASLMVLRLMARATSSPRYRSASSCGLLSRVKGCSPCWDLARAAASSSSSSSSLPLTTPSPSSPAASLSSPLLPRSAASSSMRNSRSSGVNSVMAAPASPARPVRPTRCT
mmetsp:Transcript_6393/g.15885  ORF Transcript_6393/g.15885 Transcript_6393/m.15885 type:complete len:264 (-) Transcript_6393:763-1554(-)